MAKNQKMVAAKELRGRNTAELDSLQKSKLEDLQKTQFKHALGQLRETHILKHTRRDIARLKTVLHERATQAKEGQQ